MFSRLNLSRNGHSMVVKGPDFQMKLSFAISLLVAASFAAHAQQAMPRMASVEPQAGKVGDVLVVTGENLQKDAVVKLFLTDGTNDTPVEIMEQAATTIKFKIPAKAKGRLALLVLTGGKEPKLIEQPVKVTIEEQ
jgi:hypothetical protein